MSAAPDAPPLNALPPAPTAPGRLPLLGHALPLVRRPLEFMDSLRHHGPVVRIGLGTAPAFVVTDSELTRTMLVGQSKSFLKGGRIFDALRAIFGEGLVTMPDGDEHIRKRRLMQPMFNRARVQARGEVIVDSARSVVAAWPEGIARPIYEEMNTLALSVFLAALVGTDLPKGIKDDFTRVLPVVMHGAIRQTTLPGWMTRLPLPSQRRYEANLRRMHELADATIDHERQRQADSAEHGLIHMLLTAADPETGEGLSPTQLREEVITLLTASVETTGTTLAWALYEISRNPAVERRLLEELESVCGRRPLRYADVPALTYTRSVIQEAMRRYGPAWLITRRTAAPVVLGGYRLPADADVIYSPYLVQHDPAIFPDPQRFDPDRWAPDRVREMPRSAFMAFGAGNRGCLGETFAWIELVLILAVIVGRWRVSPPPGTRVRTVVRATVYPDRLAMTPWSRQPGPDAGSAV